MMLFNARIQLLPMVRTLQCTVNCIGNDATEQQQNVTD